MEPERAANSSDRYETLDGLRGVAAIAIVLHHGGGLFKPFHLANAALAVDFFFALSGFVIAHSYEPRLRQGTLTLGGFTLKRFIRFYPLYLLGTLLGLLGALLGRPEDNLFAEAAPALLMLPSPGTFHLYPLNRVAWSLGFEMLINVAYAASWFLWTKRNLGILLVISGLLLAIAAASTGTADGGWNWNNLAMGFPRVTFSFAAGVMIYKSLPTIATVKLPVPFLVALLIAALAIPLGWGYQLLCIFVLFPVILISGAQNRAPPLSRAYLWLGAVSYASYAIHRPVISLLTNGAEDGLGLDLRALAPASGAVFLLLFLFGCWLADAVYDVPVRRWISRMVRGLPFRAAQRA